jgi:hypothetical protein
MAQGKVSIRRQKNLLHTQVTIRSNKVPDQDHFDPDPRDRIADPITAK